MTEDRDMDPELLKKFDEWFRTPNQRGLFIAALDGRLTSKRLAGWRWTELKIDRDHDINIMEYYRNLVKIAESLKGTSQ